MLGGWSPFTVNAAAAGATITTGWTASAEHSARDWVGLYASGDPDTAPLAWQYAGGGATHGHLTFTAPARAGDYEFRYFLKDGVSRAASGNRVTVR